LATVIIISVFLCFISNHSQHTPHDIPNYHLLWLCLDEPLANLLYAQEQLAHIRPFEPLNHS
jgi:hypothetical protein